MEVVWRVWRGWGRDGSPMRLTVQMFAVCLTDVGVSAALWGDWIPPPHASEPVAPGQQRSWSLLYGYLGNSGGAGERYRTLRRYLVGSPAGSHL